MQRTKHSLPLCQKQAPFLFYLIYVSGFSKKVGIAFSFAVDLWGVYEGLCLARKIGLVVVEVNIDCQAVVDSLCGSKTGCAVGCRLINSIRSMINTNWQVVFKHSY